MSMPQFQDRSVEIKLLGGLASFKMGEPNGTCLPLDHQIEHTRSKMLIEAKSGQTEVNLNTLTTLYEQDLISKEEFELAKQRLIQG
jgi:hypothetical protein